MISAIKKYSLKYFLYDLLLFVYITVPMLCAANILGLFNLTYDITADIKTDYSGGMNVQLFFLIDGVNGGYDERYSIRKILKLQKGKYSKLSLRLNHADKTLNGFRLDLGDRPSVQINLKNLMIGGQSIANVSDTEQYGYNDLILTSKPDADEIEFRTTGSDPFFVSKGINLSPASSREVLDSARNRVFLIISAILIISSISFFIIRYLVIVNYENLAIKGILQKSGNQMSALSGHSSDSKIYSLFFLLFSIVVLLFFRNPQIFTHPAPLSEDFGIFIGQEYRWGILHSAFVPYNGYLHLLPRLIAWFAMKFDLPFVMIIMNWSVLCVKLLTCYLIYQSEEISSNLIKFSVIAYLVLFPFPDEIYNSPTSLQWWLIPLMTILIIRRETNLPAFIFNIFMLLVAGLTGVNSIILVLPCVYMLFKFKNLDYLVKMTIIMICALLQLKCLFESPRVGNIMYEGGVINLINAFVNGIIYRTLFVFYTKSPINIFVFLIYVSALVFNFYYYRKQIVVHFIYLFYLTYLIIIFYSIVRSSNIDSVITGHSADRYFFFLKICTFVLFVSTFQLLLKAFLCKRNYKRCMVYLCFLLCLILMKNYHVSLQFWALPLNDSPKVVSQYYDDIKRFKSARPGDVVQFHYYFSSFYCHNPDTSPWICDLTKK